MLQSVQYGPWSENTNGGRCLNDQLRALRADVQANFREHGIELNTASLFDRLQKWKTILRQTAREHPSIGDEDEMLRNVDNSPRQLSIGTAYVHSEFNFSAFEPLESFCLASHFSMLPAYAPRMTPGEAKSGGFEKEEKNEIRPIRPRLLSESSYDMLVKMRRRAIHQLEPGTSPLKGGKDRVINAMTTHWDFSEPYVTTRRLLTKLWLDWRDAAVLNEHVEAKNVDVLLTCLRAGSSNAASNMRRLFLHADQPTTGERGKYFTSL
ncbi:hypothetical protein [Sandaracinobacteroides saxicola]|uniref:Uncharacterized protein n=1 Tax=Sandaracinobacteroides saxicola TaxID=2759707 RepID=A0A7G5IJP6_9SPHN|nr:hypothetical protein [Sandaracinobacteroides saxicola]QMW23588.1 hypothetical protein H3309_03580 [Sandaracinobacteroides saxicola]